MFIEKANRVGDVPISKAFFIPNTLSGITPNIPKSQPKEKKKKKAKEKEDVIDLGRLDLSLSVQSKELTPPSSFIISPLFSFLIALATV